MAGKTRQNPSERSLSAEFHERVYELVERIPPGRVLSYGVIAEILGEGGSRNVGRAMSLSGGLPWWRVVRADGRFPACDRGEALGRYRSENTALRPGETSVDMRQAFWNGPY